MDNNKPIPTKERILNAAFSFYDKLSYKKISLSMIASKVGISKAAIFKHFKNKDELEAEMMTRVYNKFFDIVKDSDYENEPYSESIKKTAVSLVKIKEYLNYSTSTAEGFLVDDLIINFRSRGLGIFQHTFSDGGKILDEKLFTLVVYIAGSILCYHFSRECIVKKLGFEDTSEALEEYADKLGHFLQDGIGHGRETPDIERLKELDELCATNMTGFPEISKEFLAISAMIEKQGFKGVTVEGIANSLGIAKSSLYSRFSSKNNMVQSSINEEIDLMISTIQKNIHFAKTPSECIYVIMETILHYTMKRRAMFFVSKWIRFQDFEASEGINEDDPTVSRHDEFYSFLCKCNLIDKDPDLGKPEIGFRAFSAWLFSIPVYLLMHSRRISDRKRFLQKNLKYIFYKLEYGLDYEWEEK